MSLLDAFSTGDAFSKALEIELRAHKYNFKTRPHPSHPMAKKWALPDFLIQRENNLYFLNVDPTQTVPSNNFCVEIINTVWRNVFNPQSKNLTLLVFNPRSWNEQGVAKDLDFSSRFEALNEILQTYDSESRIDTLLMYFDSNTNLERAPSKGSEIFSIKNLSVNGTPIARKRDVESKE